MARVRRFISYTSPNVFSRKRMRLPSWEKSARSPNVVSCVMWRGRLSAGDLSAEGDFDCEGTTAGDDRQPPATKTANRAIGRIIVLCSFLLPAWSGSQEPVSY